MRACVCVCLFVCVLLIACVCVCVCLCMCMYVHIYHDAKSERFVVIKAVRARLKNGFVQDLAHTYI